MTAILKPWFGAWPGIFLATFALFALAIPSGLLGDPGALWHIRTGEWMLDHKQVLRHDPFSQSDLPWIPTQWLGEIFMGLAYRAGGLAGVTTLAAILIATWISIPVRRWYLAGMHPILVLLLAMLMLKVGAIQIHARPLLVTFLGITILAFLILDIGKKRAGVAKLLWYLPLAVLWANCHGGYLGGLAMLGIANSVWLLEALFSKGPLGERKNLFLLVLADLGWVLAPCVSPFGLDLYREWIKIWFKLDLSSYILEHQPPGFTDFYMLGGYLVLAVITLFFLKTRDRPPFLASMAVLWAWFFMTIQRARNAPLFIGVAVPFFEEIWTAAVASGKIREDWIVRDPPTPSRCVKSLLAGLVLVVFAFSWLGWFQVSPNPEKLPLDLVTPMRELSKTYGEGTRVYNTLNDGGFLIFYSPKWKVFQDDRCEIHAFRDGVNGGDWLKKIVKLETEQPEVLLLELQKQRIPVAVLRKESPLATLLARDPAWQESVKGRTHSIWTTSP